MINKFVLRYFLLLLIGLLSTKVYAQNVDINRFFNTTKSYNAYPAQKVIFYPGGTLLRFYMGEWNYRRGVRFTSTKTLFSKVKLEDISNSNSVSFFMENENIKNYFVIGGELVLQKARSLSQVGFELFSKEEVISDYYAVFYASNSLIQRNIIVEPTWRTILYFSPQLYLEGEMIGLENVYFIRSTYQYVNFSSKLSKSPTTSFFILEKSDQTVIAVANTLQKRVLWQIDDLSSKDKIAVGLFIGIINNIRFAVGKSGLAARKDYLATQENRSQKRDRRSPWKLKKEDIILPEDLGRAVIQE